MPTGISAREAARVGFRAADHIAGRNSWNLQERIVLFSRHPVAADSSLVQGVFNQTGATAVIKGGDAIEDSL